MILPSFLFKNVVKKIHFRIVLDSIYFLQYWLISHGPESSPIVKPNKWLRGDSQCLILLGSLWDGYNFLGTSQFLTVTFHFESFIGGIFIQLFQIYFWALARLFFLQEIDCSKKLSPNLIPKILPPSSAFLKLISIRLSWTEFWQTFLSWCGIVWNGVLSPTIGKIFWSFIKYLPRC